MSTRRRRQIRLPWSSCSSALRRIASLVACEERAVPIDDEHVMISMPYVNPTPWRTPREAEEPQLAERIAALAGQFADHGKVIFNFHAPPKDSTLDTCPMLDG